MKNIVVFFIAIALVSCHAVPASSPVRTVMPSDTASPLPETPSITNTPSLEVEISNLLSRYGWTINQLLAVNTLTLPKSLQHNTGDYPYAIYWAYNNEFNKAVGLNLVPYLGQTISAHYYLLNEPLPEGFPPNEEARAVAITFEHKIIGAWIEKTVGFLDFACSLDRRQLIEITGKGWNEWLASSGVVDLSNELDAELSTKTPEEIVEIYYTALDEHNYRLLNAVRSRRNNTYDLFVNKQNLALFNQQEESSFMLWINNIKGAQLTNTETIDNPINCLPVIGASVDYQFIDPNVGAVSDGDHLSFLVLIEEIKGLGWRIEEINSDPLVSQHLCTP